MCALSIVSLTVLCLCLALPFVTIKHVFCHNIYHTVLTLPNTIFFFILIKVHFLTTQRMYFRTDTLHTGHGNIIISFHVNYVLLHVTRSMQYINFDKKIIICE